MSALSHITEPLIHDIGQFQYICLPPLYTTFEFIFLGHCTLFISRKCSLAPRQDVDEAQVKVKVNVKVLS